MARVINPFLEFAATTGGGSLAVNGKEPIAAWVPSLDSAGNGTTTLTDLVGSNDGTLTNMDPPTDWVPDTDAGGVRALDCDAVNDGVQIPAASELDIAANFSVSVWAYTRNTGGVRSLAVTHDAPSKRGWAIGFVGQRVYCETSGTLRYLDGSAFTSYCHIVSVVSGAATLTLYVNGVSVFSGTIAAITSYSTSVWIGRRMYPSFADQLNGRVDDIRIFNTALDSSDVAYLYDSGNGRGREA